MVLCFGVVMKILVTQQCVTVLTQSWEGTADPRGVPDPGEEAGRGGTSGVCVPKSPLGMTEPLGMAKLLPAEGNKELISCFAFLACAASALPSKLSLSRPMHMFYLFYPLTASPIPWSGSEELLPGV